MSSSSFKIDALLCFALIASASSLVLPIHTTSAILNFTSSNTTTNLNGVRLPTSDGPKPLCDGGFFGNLLQPASCFEAIQKIKTGNERLSFGPRGRRAFNIQLPRRLSSADGTCVVEISHKEGTFGDIASGNEILRPALDILKQCVGNPSREGGMTRDIGQFGNLLVAIRRYEPSVLCIGPVRPTHNVGQDLLDKIPVDTAQQVFGPKGKAGVGVAVPNVITRDLWVLPPYDWQAEVDILSGTKTMGRWYDMWSGAVAVNAMCVERRGRSGQSLSNGGLRITLDHAFKELASNGTSLTR